MREKSFFLLNIPLSLERPHQDDQRQVFFSKHVGWEYYRTCLIMRKEWCCTLCNLTHKLQQCEIDGHILQCWQTTRSLQQSLAAEYCLKAAQCHQCSLEPFIIVSKKRCTSKHRQPCSLWPESLTVQHMAST